MEDSDADEVPKGVPDDEESTYDDWENEEQSVNGDLIVTTNNKDDDNTNKANTEVKGKETNKVNQEGATYHGAEIAEGISTEAGDPGGTQKGAIQNKITGDNQQQSVNDGNELQTKQTSSAPENTVPLK